MQKTLLSIFFLFLLTNTGLGVHNLGSRMSYECLGNGNYRIIFTDYLECAGSPMFQYIPVGNAIFPSSPMHSTSMDSNCPDGLATQVGNWTVFSFSDISLLCPSIQSSCQDLNSLFYLGVAELTSHIEYQLQPSSCGEYTFTATACCRDVTITSLVSPGSHSLYNELTIPVTTTGCNNSSPQFLTHPRTVICNTDTISINVSAFDPDGDSLDYQFYQPKRSNSQGIDYNTGYSMMAPLGPGWYFDLNNETGELRVAGIGASFEVGIVGIEVREFRNGVYLGSSKSEFPIFGQDQDCDPNTSTGPAASPAQLISGGIQGGPFSLEAFVGIPLQFEISFTGDSSQALLLDNTLQTQLPGATITSTGSNPLNVQVSWTPDSSYLNQVFHAGPTVTDQSCVAPNFAYQPIRFHVRPSGYTSTVSPSSCTAPTGSIDLDLVSSLGSVQFLWNTGDTTEDLSGLSPGQYHVDISSSAGFYLQDTFVITAGRLESGLLLQKPSCDQNDGSITATPSGGTPPYTFQWSTGASVSTLSNLAAGGYSVLITDSSGCVLQESFILEENDSCASLASGRVYADLNGNCTFDGADQGIAGALVYSSQGYGVFTDSLGHYSMRLEPGSFTLKAYLRGDSLGCNTGGYSLNLAPGDEMQGLDFSWTSPPGPGLTLTGVMGGVVPGDTVQVLLQGKNTGFGSIGGFLEMTYDPSLNFGSSHPPATSHDPLLRTIRWDFAGLDSWSNYPVQVFFEVDSGLSLGTVLTNEANISGGDSLILQREVGTATLPYEKQVSPKGMGELGLIKADQYDHEYHIDLQHTGNLPARNVLVRDTLDPDLRLKSLNPIYTSHDFRGRLLPGGILELYFEDINLEGTASAPANRRAGISFFVKHKENLVAGTQIINRAEIEFDFFPPVVSNQVLNTIYTQPVLQIDPAASGIYCRGEALEAVLSAEGMAPYSYTWSTGDRDSLVNALQSSTTLGTSGWYVVSVVDSFGIFAVDSLEITLSQRPSIQLDWTLGAGPITFEAGDSSIVSYLWTFSNGDTSTDAQPTVDPDGLANLGVQLIASNDCGSDTATVDLILASLEAGKPFGRVNLMPNPVGDVSILEFENILNEEVSLYILDPRGKIVTEMTGNRGHSFKIESANMPAGIYLYKLSTRSGKVHFGKMIFR